MAVFWDLNVPWDKANCANYGDICRTAVKLGYGAIALNNISEELTVKSGKKSKEKVVAIVQCKDIVVPPEVSSLQLAGCSVKEDIQHYKRFTATISDLAQSIRLKDAVVQEYDIVAVQPTSTKVFHEACKTFNIDLISLDLTERFEGMLVGKPARAAVGCAIARGVHFEIRYGPMIHDASARRMTISNASKLVELCHGKNIILTSGAEKPINLRGPYDIINLALLLGMSEDQARSAVSANCRSLLLHSVARRSANGAVSCVRSTCLQSIVTETDAEPPVKRTKQVVSAGNERNLQR